MNVQQRYLPRFADYYKLAGKTREPIVSAKKFKCSTMYYVLHVERMENEVVVTRKGQTTIPVRLRKKFKIEQGTRLEVIETKEGILFKPKLTTWDLAGSGAKYATVKEMNKLLDKMRAEDREEDE